MKRQIVVKSHVEKWLDNVALSHSGSQETNTSYARIFNEYCDSVGTTPEQIIGEYERAEQGKESERTLRRHHAEKISSYVNALKSDKLAVGSMHAYATAIMSFYKYNDLPLAKVILPQVYITYHNRDITHEEINLIIAKAPLMNRAYFVTMAQSGLRPVTIGQLRVCDVEKILDKDTPIPCMITVSREIEKGHYHSGHPSFIGEDAVTVIKQYLATRPNLTQDSLLFMSKYQGEYKPTDVRSMSHNFRKIVHSLRDSGSMNFETRDNKPAEIRLYNLRKFFRKFANQMGFEHVNYLMNHSTNGSDGHYTPKDTEFYRQLYAEKAMPFLRLEAPSANQTNEIIKTLKVQHSKEIEALKAEYEKKFADMRKELMELAQKELLLLINEEWRKRGKQE